MAADIMRSYQVALHSKQGRTSSSMPDLRGAEARFSNLRPYWIAATAYVAMLCVLLIQAWHIDRLQQLYAVDDAYIHLAISKNLLTHHVFGVTPYGFTGASSSVVWPFLLAALGAMLGLHVWLPFVLNVALSLLLLWLANRWLWRLGVASDRLRAIALLSIAVLAPLSSLTSLGLEHVLQSITALGLLVAASEVLDRSRDVKAVAPLLVWTVLATSSRYEIAFEVVCICALLAWQRRVGLAAAVAAAGFLPILAFGIFSMSHPGSHFFPNSLLLKTASASTALSDRVAPMLHNLTYAGKHLLPIAWAVVLGLSIASTRKRKTLSAAAAAGIITVGVSVLHTLFSRMGQLGRYESYLVVLTIFSLFALLVECAEFFRSTRMAAWLVACAVVALLPRAAVIVATNADAVQSIFLQQYQMAKFFERNYPTTPIAVNDVGAVNYFRDGHTLDLFGLTSSTVLNMKLAHEYDTNAMRQLAAQDGVRVVAVYVEWFQGAQALPAEWTYAGSLTPKCPSRHATVGGFTIAFYAVHPEDVSELRAKLAANSVLLPQGTKVTEDPWTRACLA
jgi:hypothetical protein